MIIRIHLKNTFLINEANSILNLISMLKTLYSKYSRWTTKSFSVHGSYPKLFSISCKIDGRNVLQNKIKSFNQEMFTHKTLQLIKALCEGRRKEIHMHHETVYKLASIDASLPMKCVMFVALLLHSKPMLSVSRLNLSHQPDPHRPLAYRLYDSHKYCHQQSSHLYLY